MVPMKKNHVLAALLLVATTAAIVGRGVQGATTSTNVVGAANKALIFGIVPCSKGSSIDVATAPPFANATVQLQCAAVPALSRSKPDNIAESEGRQSSRDSRGPVVISAADDDDITVWATVKADTDGEFVLELGVTSNSGGGGGGGGGLLSSSRLANNCEVAVTTPLAACDASLARVNGTLRAPVRPICTVGTFQGFAAAPFSFV